MIKLAVSGCAGKMGTRIINLALQDKDLQVVVGLEASTNPSLGQPMGKGKITDNCDEIKSSDVLIEFSTPEATLQHLEYALKHKKAMVIGTTGLSEEQISRIRQASQMIPIVFSPNMSVGVNILFKLVREAAEKLSGYTARIVEAHHVHKKDAPSGTAKKLALIIKEASGREVADIKAIREGEIIGDHKITFEGPLDTIELSHSAKTRDVFASGALVAAKYVFGKPARLYDISDVIQKGLK